MIPDAIKNYCFFPPRLMQLSDTTRKSNSTRDVEYCMPAPIQ